MRFVTIGKTTFAPDKIVSCYSSVDQDSYDATGAEVPVWKVFLVRENHGLVFRGAEAVAFGDWLSGQTDIRPVAGNPSTKS